MLRRHLFLLGFLAGAFLLSWSALAAEPAPKSAAAQRDEAAAPAVAESEDETPDDDDEAPPEKPARKNDRRLTEAQKTPTHKQVRVLQPLHADKPVSLDTFCLRKNGNLLACVQERPQNAGDDADDAPADHTLRSFIQEYDPDGKLVQEIPAPFHATAINVAPNGAVFIAGDGKMAKIVGGKVTGETPTPQIGDYEAFKKQVLEAAKEEIAEFCKGFDQEIKSLKKQVEKLEAKSEKQELTKREEAQLKAAKQSLEQQEQQIQAVTASMGDADEQVRQRLAVTALGVTDSDVFISVMSAKGHGYEAWRTNHDFQEPKQVVASLSGCCGQMDLQARGDKLFVAENGKFEVSIRDRDGKRLARFGKRDRNAVDGFGSCCNPMNIRCCENDDVLVAESSIGNIKRFNARGEFVGLIGKAKIGIGCKHVALGFDEARNRYYMMNVDKGHIAVLIPVGEVPPETEAEKAARLATADFAKRLIGRWAPAGAGPQKKPAKNALAGLIESVIGDTDSDLTMPEQPFDSVTFLANGGLRADGGMLGMYGRGNELSWEAVSLQGKTLEVSINMDGAEFTSARVEMLADDEIEVRTQMFGSGEFGKPYRFKREKAAEKAGAEKPIPEKTR